MKSRAAQIYAVLDKPQCNRKKKKQYNPYRRFNQRKSAKPLAQSTLITQAGSESVGLCQENQLVIRSPEKNCRPNLVCTNHMSFLVSTNLCGTG